MPEDSYLFFVYHNNPHKYQNHYDIKMTFELWGFIIVLSKCNIIMKMKRMPV